MMSMMEDVRGRIEWVRTASLNEGDMPEVTAMTPVPQLSGAHLLLPLSPHVSRMPTRSPWLSGGLATPFATSAFSESPCPSEQVPAAAAAAIMAPVFQDCLDYSSEFSSNKCHISFRRLVIGVIISFVLLTCALMYITLEVSTTAIRNGVIQSCNKATQMQQAMVDQLVFQNVTEGSFRSRIRSVGVMVEELIKQPADRAVYAVWDSIRTARHFNLSHDINGSELRQRLAYRSWAELERQWGMAAANWGAVRSARGATSWVPIRAPDSLAVHFLSGESAGCEVRRRGAQCPDAGPATCGTCRGWCTWLTAETFTSAASSNGSGAENVTRWAIDPATGSQVHRVYGEGPAPNGAVPPGMAVQLRQAELARERSGGAAAFPAQPAWSKLHMSDGVMKLAWTLPIAYCGDYSCLEGAIAAGVALREVSKDCIREWSNLARLLASPAYNFRVGHGNSSIFIVEHISELHPEDQGLLVGTSDAYELNRAVYAETAAQQAVRAAACALLAKFGAWNATKLVQEEHLLAFRTQSAVAGKFKECDPTSENAHAQGCQQVGTLSVRLDDHTRWLVVATLPAGAFNGPAVGSLARAGEQVELLRSQSTDQRNQARMAGVIVILLIAATSAGLGFGLGCAVSKPLRRLSDLMQLLGDFDFLRQSAELDKLRSGVDARLVDISELQGAFYHLLRGVEAFARFVPETVVTRIVRGDRRATRLHVDKRNVTVMFSSIADFASVSESLSEEALVRLLTRYHTAMTSAVESHDGQVAEILDSGLLVYWNSPDNVPNHAAKACEAALAQQRAVELLNEKFAVEGLPELTVHIGLHTGNVLSGNIGSTMKMKFGCMGDSVNLASRLNGLCKYYGVRVVCSGVTYGSLPPSTELLCRQLDLVKVKGRREPTPVFEIVGHICATPSEPVFEHSVTAGACSSICSLDEMSLDVQERPLEAGSGACSPSTAIATHTLVARHPSPFVMQGSDRSATTAAEVASSPAATASDGAAAPATATGAAAPAVAPPAAAAAGAAAAGGAGAAPPPPPTAMPALVPAAAAPRAPGPFGPNGGANAAGGFPTGGIASTVAMGAVPVSHALLSVLAAELRASQGEHEDEVHFEIARSTEDVQPEPRRGGIVRRVVESLPVVGRHTPVSTSRNTEPSGKGCLPAAPSPAVLGRKACKAPTADPRAVGHSVSSMERNASSSSAKDSDTTIVSHLERLRVQRYEEALRLFQQARFEEARGALIALVQDQPSNKAARLLLDRAEKFVGRDPEGGAGGGLSQDELASWTGVTDMTDK